LRLSAIANQLNLAQRTPGSYSIGPGNALKALKNYLVFLQYFDRDFNDKVKFSLLVGSNNGKVRGQRDDCDFLSLADFGGVKAVVVRARQI